VITDYLKVFLIIGKMFSQEIAALIIAKTGPAGAVTFQVVDDVCWKLEVGRRKDTIYRNGCGSAAYSS
jgi:hypothetical protein